VPIKFATDVSFRSIQEADDGVRPEHSEFEIANYQSLLIGCREFARTCPKRSVEFEIKISFFKEGAAIAP
jgi:hypothetical protein